MNEQDSWTPDPEAVRQVLRAYGPLIAGWVLIVTGVVAITIGWFGVSRNALVAKQVPYLVSGGLGGLALIVTGAAVLAGLDARRLGSRLDTLEEKVADLHEVLLVETPDGLSPEAASGNGHPVGDGYRVLPSGTKIHRPDCPVVTDKDAVEELTREEAVGRELEPCRLCEPDLAASG